MGTVVRPDPKRTQWIVVGNSVIQYDGPTETSRLEMYEPILSKYGVCLPHTPLDLSKYERADQFVRCFDVALLTAHRHNLTYMEGVAVFDIPELGVFTQGHAWCLDENRQVVDVTFCGRPALSDFTTYRGVAIKKEYALMYKLKWGFVGVLDGHPTGKKEGIHFDNPGMWIAGY